MGLSYAGVTLPVLTPEVYRAIESRIPTVDMNPWGTAPAAVGRGGFGLSAQKWNSRPPRIGHLAWPTGASRWATGYFLATDQNLADIRANLATISTQAGDIYSPAPLVLSDGANTVTANMSMLMARPLLGSVPGSELWMLVLVDQRYYWWRARADKNYTTVNNYSTNPYQFPLSQVFFYTFTFPFSYDTPEVPFPEYIVAPYEPAPVLMDWIATVLGQRLVFGLDGTVHAYNVATAQTLNKANKELSNPFIAGGDLAVNGDSNDLSALLPRFVQVDFEPTRFNPEVFTSKTAQPSADSVTVALADLDLVPASVQPAYDTVRFVYPLSSADFYSTVATTDRQTAAKTWATSFYDWLLASADYVLAGIAEWTLTGLESWVDWQYNQYSPAGVSTRIHRQVWEYTDHLPHPPEFAYLCTFNVNTDDPVTPVPAAGLQIVGLAGRTITDAILTSGSPTITSATANFTSSDVGTVLLGNGIANGFDSPNPLQFPPTTIASITSPTAAVMSAAATTTVSNGAVALASQWALGTEMFSPPFNYGPVSVTGEATTFSDNYGSSVLMLPEREGGMTSSFSTRLYREMIYGQYAIAERVYLGRLVGVDLFGTPIYTAKVEPVEWYIQSDGTLATATITLESTGTSVKAFSVTPMQYVSSGHGGTGSPYFYAINPILVPGGQAYWFDGQGPGAGFPPPTGIFKAKQIDCTTTGCPVFGGECISPRSGTPQPSINYTPTTTYAYTGNNLVLSQPGVYLVSVAVPGYISGAPSSGYALSLFAGLSVYDGSTDTPTGTRQVIASVPTGVSGNVEGTTTLTAIVTVVTVTKTVKLWAYYVLGSGTFSSGSVGSTFTGLNSIVWQSTSLG